LILIDLLLYYNSDFFSINDGILQNAKDMRWLTSLHMSNNKETASHSSSRMQHLSTVLWFMSIGRNAVVVILSGLIGIFLNVYVGESMFTSTSESINTYSI
jgi:Mg2+/Co2+ transporter CorB